ncbi:MAG: hypothetical protein ACE5I5_15650 [Candidatus Heimdallarchaeota archaeon]
MIQMRTKIGSGMRFPKVDLYKKRTLVVVWLILSNFLLFFGGTINPLTAGEQFRRRTQLTSLLDPRNPDIGALNDDFEQFLHESEQVVKTSDDFSSLVEYEVKMVEIFTYLRVKHKSDLMQYLTVDHLPTVGEVMRSGVDDCDGRAIFAATLLVYRGYDAWVLANPVHYWVEIILGNGIHLRILGKKGVDTWYLRFDNQETVFNAIQTVGFVLYEWILVSLMMIFIFYSQKTFSQSPFLKLAAKVLSIVIVVTQIIYFGALGIVLMLYRII